MALQRRTGIRIAYSFQERHSNGVTTDRGAVWRSCGRFHTVRRLGVGASKGPRTRRAWLKKLDREPLSGCERWSSISLYVALSQHMLRLLCSIHGSCRVFLSSYRGPVATHYGGYDSRSRRGQPPNRPEIRSSKPTGDAPEGTFSRGSEKREFRRRDGSGSQPPSTSKAPSYPARAAASNSRGPARP